MGFDGMNRDGYQKIPRPFKTYGCKSFREISISKGGKKQKYCVENSYVSELKAIEFDTVVAGLYASLQKDTGRRPCSVDALFYSGQDVYAIEFKTGKVCTTDVVRKLYDSVMCLIEHARGSFDWARSHVVAVVVATKEMVEKESKNRDKNKTSSRTVFSRARAYQRNPEIGEGRRPLWGLDKLEQILVSKVYTLSPEDFALFAEKRDWE